jgi:hypothetical protein
VSTNAAVQGDANAVLLLLVRTFSGGRRKNFYIYGELQQQISATLSLGSKSIVLALHSP